MENPLVGIDIGATKMRMVAKWSDRIDSELISTGSEIPAGEIEQAITKFVDRLSCDPKALGIAVAALVDENGEIQSGEVLPSLLNWSPKSVFNFNFPIVVMNDAVAALSEESHDLPQKSTAAVIVVGTGTGAALLVDGKQVVGARGWAGEIGSIPIMLLDKTVKSLNDLAGGGSILRDLELTGEQLLQRLLEHDERVIGRVTVAGMALGLGIATLINLLNPHRITFAGRPSTLPYYSEAALAAAKLYSFPALWSACEVRRSSHGAMLVALGAARMAGMLLPASPA